MRETIERPRPEHPGFPRARILAHASTLEPGDAAHTMRLYGRIAGKVEDADFVRLMRLAYTAQRLPAGEDLPRREMQAWLDTFADLLVDGRSKSGDARFRWDEVDRDG